jgi:serine/threonine protein kinase
MHTGDSGTYNVGHVIGTGSFATIRLCVKEGTNEKFAVKVMGKKRVQNFVKPNKKDGLMEEFKIMRNLDHPRILKVYDVVDTEETLSIVMELVKGVYVYMHVGMYVCTYV